MRNWMIALLMIGICSVCEAQGKKSKRRTDRVNEPVKQKTQVAAAFKSMQYVYFPDYYAFYDPDRGYIFWNDQTKSWNSSLEPPKFMSNVDMSKTRIQILKGLSLDLHPEQNYPNYMRLYPAQTTNPDVPVPNGRQTSHDRY